ncbi:MAG: sigma-70 family RNA polymerase sigma factor [Anaerolineae bacterium]|nr:sigma-70 family RNA polymerase sigma factor [Phycisphaerae bacterium]
MSDSADEVTLVLHQLQGGDALAAERLLPLVYQELRKRSGQLMAGERKDHTLQRTALVHEAFLKLVRPGVTFESRLHFFNAAALAMRRILIDHAEARRAQKRGGGKAEVSLDDVDVEGLAPADSSGGSRGVDILALDEAMKELQSRSPRQHQVVMLRFFAGLKDAEIAAMLDMSEKTVRRDWVSARLWLHGEISK